VKLYMTSRHHHPQRAAAAASGISERTGRRAAATSPLSGRKSTYRTVRIPKPPLRPD
jgi:hypothetical protein